MDDSTKGLIMIGIAASVIALQTLADRILSKRQKSSRIEPQLKTDTFPHAKAEPWRLDAMTLAKAISTGEISAREATQSVLDRLANVNPKLNAVTVIHADSALKAADRADKARMEGEPLGLLHGVPVTIKEAIDMEGDATTSGVVAFKDVIAKSDSPTVAAWRKAGAIIVGRTNTPAFNLRWHTDNELRGRTFNPWHPDYTPGGSSGGAAAAVAAGIGPIANGGDLGGSIRYPAFCTGISGIRPGFGRVPHYNTTATQERPLGMSLMAVQGLLARTVADVRLGFRPLIEHRDPIDLWHTPLPLEGPEVTRPLKVALPTNVGELHPDVAAAQEAAANALADAGYIIEPVAIPSMDKAIQLWKDISGYEMRQLLMPGLRQFGGVDLNFVVDLYRAVNKDSGEEGYARALSERMAFIREWARFVQKYPIVVMPVSTQPPLPVGFDMQDEEGTTKLLAAQRPQLAVSVIGLPSVAVPVGIYNGLPIGVQIIGQRFREDLCLDAAEAIEQRRGILTPIDPKF